MKSRWRGMSEHMPRDWKAPPAATKAMRHTRWRSTRATSAKTRTGVPLAQRFEARRIALRQEPREAKEQNRSEQETKAAPYREPPVPCGIRGQERLPPPREAGGLGVEPAEE